jgi:glycosyltransferase involved in cell wall biosynthesis
MQKKKIIINTIPLLVKLTGVGKYIYEVSRNLTNSDSFNYHYYYGYTSDKLIHPPKQDAKKSFSLVYDYLLKSNTLRNIIRRAVFSLSNLVSKKFDLYWEPNHILLPNIKSDIKITTIHDLSVIKNPERHPADRVRYFNKNITQTILNSHHFITVSKFIKQEITEYFGISPEKITVIYNGFNQDIFRKYHENTLIFFAKQKKIPENFILYVGTIEPRKNLKNLILAYLELPEKLKKQYKLVLTGYHGWENSEIFNFIKKERENIIYTGYMDELELAYLYNLAKVLVYPSIYEGFGLPPLEAMACETPVITSNVSSMPEIYEDAAFYIDPKDPYDIKQAVETILEDNILLENLKQKGKERSMLFSWENSAKNHLKLFKSFFPDLT